MRQVQVQEKTWSCRRFIDSSIVMPGKGRLHPASFEQRMLLMILMKSVEDGGVFIEIISSVCQSCTTSITHLHFCHMNLLLRKVYPYFQTQVQFNGWEYFSTRSIHVVFNPLDFNLNLSVPSNTC